MSGVSEMIVTVDVDIENNEGTESPWWVIVNPSINNVLPVSIPFVWGVMVRVRQRGLAWKR